eukprot:scaffold27042_cov62-Isochrysis_galbana.AAC.1
MVGKEEEEGKKVEGGMHRRGRLCARRLRGSSVPKAASDSGIKLGAPYWCVAVTLAAAGWETCPAC